MDSSLMPCSRHVSTPGTRIRTPSTFILPLNCTSARDNHCEKGIHLFEADVFASTPRSERYSSQISIILLKYNSYRPHGGVWVLTRIDVFPAKQPDEDSALCCKRFGLVMAWSYSSWTMILRSRNPFRGQAVILRWDHSRCFHNKLHKFLVSAKIYPVDKGHELLPFVQSWPLISH